MRTAYVSVCADLLSDIHGKNKSKYYRIEAKNKKHQGIVNSVYVYVYVREKERNRSNGSCFELNIQTERVPNSSTKQKQKSIETNK